MLCGYLERPLFANKGCTRTQITSFGVAWRWLFITNTAVGFSTLYFHIFHGIIHQTGVIKGDADTSGNGLEIAYPV